MTLEDITIRYDWHPEERRWHYSIVDAIDTVVVTRDARNYWKVLKNRLKKSDNALVGACNQLRLPSRDGKRYLTDTADKKTLVLLIEHLAGPLDPTLEHWINIVECSKPDKKSVLDKKPEESFPQQEKARNFSNRLKRLFRF